MIRYRGIVVLAAAVLALTFGAAYGRAYARLWRVAATGEEKSDSSNGTPQKEVVKEVYPNGAIKSETPLVGGKIHGKRKFYAENGSVLKEEEYREGKREGLSLEYYDGGILKKLETFRDDRLNGDYFMYYPNGQKMMAGQCVDGKKSGKWTLFHNNGNKYMEGSYTEGVMEGVWRSYSPEGWLDSEGEYRNGLQEDLWVYYDKYKKIMKKLTMKNGMIDGPCWIYTQGRLSGEGTMTGLAHDPKKNGSWKAYYKNGKVKYEGVFAMGLKSGHFREFYTTGNNKGTGDYVNDKRTGKWVFYAKDGAAIDPEKSGQYINGKLLK